MNRPITIERNVHFTKRRKGQKQIREGKAPATVVGPCVPRISRLMALAIKFDRLVRDGVVADYAELARLGQVSRARITQIMNLMQLAPDIQEQLLFLPRVEQGETIHLRQLQAIAAMIEWRDQRTAWAA